MSDATQPPGPYKRILFCTDFSENADYAFGFALDAVVRRPEAALLILHIIPEPDAQFWKTYIYEVDGVDQKARRDIDQKIADAYLHRLPPGVKSESHNRIGRDYIEILKFAEEHKADVIILGRHGHTALGHALFGSVTEKIVRKAHCPVLVVPLPPATAAKGDATP